MQHKSGEKEADIRKILSELKKLESENQEWQVEKIEELL